MSLKKTSRSQHSSLNELNITPLLDLVFVLLVIFIITTPQMMNNLEINLPSGKPPPQKPKTEPTRIEVSAQGQITLDNAPVTPSQLKEKLAALKAEDGSSKWVFTSRLQCGCELQQLGLSASS